MSLIVAACPVNFRGEYIAPELARAQTIPNLIKFGERLATLDRAFKARGKMQTQSKSKKPEATSKPTWKIVLYDRRCIVMRPEETVKGRILFEHSSRNVVGHVQAKSTMGEMDGTRRPSYTKFEDQARYTSEVAGRVLEAHPEWAEEVG